MEGERGKNFSFFNTKFTVPPLPKYDQAAKPSTVFMFIALENGRG